MKLVGFIGWRGLVGTVLLKRLYEEGDLSTVHPFFFSTSAAKASFTDPAGMEHQVADADSVSQLAAMDILVSCQGSAYTKRIYTKLRQSGWKGYWIDSASAKRLDADAVIALDPVNQDLIESALKRGVKNFIGGNCSITLTVLGLAGLFRAGLVEWMMINTYQAASGAGAAYVRELLAQMHCISEHVSPGLLDPQTPASALLDAAFVAFGDCSFPQANFGAPLAGNLLPWIDADLGDGRSREEWKSEVELNKLLNLAPETIRVESICARVSVLRSHSAAVVFKLKEAFPLDVIAHRIQEAHPWVELVPNTAVATRERLTPAAVSGTLRIAVGRLRPLNIGERLYSAFTVGDQLLWGAAEPLRRVLAMVLAHRKS